jgi:predicted ArsR family transcriptional regulator
MRTLFNWQETYPSAPGFKKRETSRRAAREMKPKAPKLRDQCLAVFQKSDHPLTADEVAKALGKSVLSIRPRVTDLVNKQLIKDSGVRRENASGKDAIAWEVVSNG